MTARLKSLRQLGSGAWKVASSTPAGRAVRHLGATPRRGPTPHDILWDAVSRRWPEAVRELCGAIPGRKYRLDIGFAEARLGVEVDGFEYHGRHLADFKRDRVRQNELVIAGWRLLRFSAGQIRTDTLGCVNAIERALAAGGCPSQCMDPKEDR